jgi:hypothetical protein
MAESKRGKRSRVKGAATVNQGESAALSPAAVDPNPFNTRGDAGTRDLTALLNNRSVARRKALQLKPAETPLAVGMGGESVAQLHGILQQVGFTLPLDETLTRRFGDSTEAALKEFQKGRGLEPTGVLDERTIALLNADATFRIEGNTPAMRKELKSALDKIDGTPELAYWLATYELLAGDYAAAHEAASRAPEFPRIKNEIMPILSLNTLQAPEMVHPSNFYTYRNAMVDSDIIRARKADIKDGLENNPNLEHLKLADLALDCFFYWNEGNLDLVRGRYIAAESSYARFYESVIRYFVNGYPKLPANLKNNTDLFTKLILLRLFFSSQQGIFLGELSPPLPDPQIFLDHIATRRQLDTLDKLFVHDWVTPALFSQNNFGSLYSNLLLLGASFLNLSVRQQKFDAPFLILACVFVPLALAEAKRLRRQYEPALKELENVLTLHNLIGVDSERLLNPLIELPYVRMQRNQILLEQANSEYKARIPSSQDPNNPDATRELRAAATYRLILKFLEDEGQYVARVQTGAESLEKTIAEVVDKPFLPMLGLGADGGAPKDIARQIHEFHILGKAMPIATIEPVSVTLPGLDRRVGQHEQLLKYAPPDNQLVLQETNPLIYALASEAQARLMQIEAGFNYLGYRDDYVPPWRFQFLLDRARYFAEHAKNAQR